MTPIDPNTRNQILRIRQQKVRYLRRRLAALAFDDSVSRDRLLSELHHEERATRGPETGPKSRSCR